MDYGDNELFRISLALYIVLSITWRSSNNSTFAMRQSAWAQDFSIGCLKVANLDAKYFNCRMRNGNRSAYLHASLNTFRKSMEIEIESQKWWSSASNSCTDRVLFIFFWAYLRPNRLKASIVFCIGLCRWTIYKPSTVRSLSFSWHFTHFTVMTRGLLESKCFVAWRLLWKQTERSHDLADSKLITARHLSEQRQHGSSKFIFETSSQVVNGSTTFCRIKFIRSSVHFEYSVHLT